MMGDQQYAAEGIDAMSDGAKDVSVEGNQATAEQDNTDAQPKAEEVPVMTQEERLWGVVKTNPADFNAWTELIQETEKLDDILRIRACYDTFLAEFPLCYGYWKKYADFEARLGSPERIVEVYERAVKAVTHSVDIWMHYCTHAADNFEIEEVLRLFERGVSFVGTDYLSHLLWDKYLEYTCRQKDWNLIMQLHTRLLEIPLQQLDRYFSSFKSVANTRPWLEVKSSEENIEAKPPSRLEEDSTTEKLPKEADELEKYIAVREAMYKKTKEWDAKIRDFENAIRRPYFHVKPLDDAQLGNWHRYLDFMEKEANLQKVVKLYERCLIACANYPEYWIRYVEFLAKQKNVEMATDALIRATQTFVKRLPEIHIFAARFKERAGDIVGARKTYGFLTNELAPCLLEAITKFANFEKRQGNIEGACSIFESAIEVEIAKEDSRTLPFLFVQYIKLLNQIGLAGKAKEVLESALQKLPSSNLVVETAIDCEYHSSEEKQLQKLDSIVQQATAAENAVLNYNDREELSSIFLEFLDSFGDIDTVMEAEARHGGLFPLRKSYIEFKRRLSHDSSFNNDRAKLLKSVSPAAAQGYGQAQWAAYGAQGYPQNWQQQQAPQAQWNAAYAQQAGYAYGAYSAYGAQQGQQAYGQSYAPQDANGVWTTGTW